MCRVTTQGNKNSPFATIWFNPHYFDFSKNGKSFTMTHKKVDVTYIHIPPNFVPSYRDERQHNHQSLNHFRMLAREQSVNHDSVIKTTSA
jgi:hypothetical protein